VTQGAGQIPVTQEQKKEMADEVRSRIFSTGTNCLDDATKGRIDEFLAGHSKNCRFVERVRLNETYENDSGVTYVITLEMNHITGRWRKLKSRSRFIDYSQLDANGVLQSYRPTLDRVICGR